ncbi:uncharacterized protein METZ01_LOCUS308005, partial [marine metagenome]
VDDVPLYTAEGVPRQSCAVRFCRQADADTLSRLSRVFEAAVANLDIVRRPLEVDTDAILSKAVVDEVAVFDSVAMGAAKVILRFSE